MLLETLVEPETAVSGKLRLFSLYVDFAASAHARRTASAIARLAGPRWPSSAEMWKLDSVSASDAIRKMINEDAAEADALIIAVGAMNGREPKLIEWLNSLAAGQRSRPVPGLLVGLLGDAGYRSQELERTAQQLISCARQIDREPVLHWMEGALMDDSDWLKTSVTALLTRKQAA